MKRRPDSNSSNVSATAWAKIKLLALDVDGVLTDGTLLISSDGTETKSFSVLDGSGMIKLREAGVTVAWISGRPSGATTVRAKELQIPHVIQGCPDKLIALRKLASSLGLSARQCCYMGDDDIDASAIAWSGIGATVTEAMPSARQAAIYVAKRPAGRGAVREVCDRILAAKKNEPKPA